MNRIRRKLDSLLHRNRHDDDLDAEVRSYMDGLAEEKRRAGLSDAEARRQAALETGGREQVKEAVRDVRALVWLEQTAQDLRYAARGLRRAPTFAAVAILTLALGIGVSTALFSVVDTVLFRPLPYPEPESLVMVYEGESGNNVLSSAELRAYRDHARTISAVAGMHPMNITVLGGQQAEHVTGALVSASLFPMLRVQPLIGRLFTEDEDRPGAGQVAIISEALWRRRFGSDPEIAGKTATFDVNERWGAPPERAQAFIIVGVLPGSFRMFLRMTEGDVWFPLATPDNGNHSLFVAARMKPGVTPEQVRADLELASAPLRGKLHGDGRPLRVRVNPLLDDLLGDWRRALLVLSGAVICVVLIACVNLANLLALRGQARRREMSVRVALGAGRGRLVRQTLAESGLLAGVGGAMGLVVAQWCIALLSATGPEDVARLGDVQLDGRVLFFAMVFTAAAAATAGLLAALRVSGRTSHDELREGARNVDSRGGNRLRAALVVAQVALALVLLAGSGLMIQTLAGLMRVETGFNAENVLTMRLALPRERYNTAASRLAFYEPLFERIRALPDVESVAVDQIMPFGRVRMGTHVGRSPEKVNLHVYWRTVSPHYFEALKIPVLRGRVFTDADMRGGRVVIVDQELARRLWGADDPVGQMLHLGKPPGYTVVGLVGSLRTGELTGDVRPQVLFAAYPRTAGLLIRTTSAPETLGPAVRRIITELEPSLAPSDERMLADRIASDVAVQRYTALLLSLFAATALALGAIGLYGVISYSVSRRVNEIGLRLALGASRTEVLRMVLRQGMGMVLLGSAFGVAAALGVTRFLAGLLFGVAARDPVTLAAVTATLLAVGLLACWAPARRAARVDPMVALRHE